MIAVDQFGINQINCGDDDGDSAPSGIALLCRESVRFTHAYTTSTLSGPALTSVLTGKYPIQHGLRGTGKSFLSSHLVTLAETAQHQQVATSFFSGGAPVLRKLNVQQGFEVFDDHIGPNANRMHRPFAKLQKLFENWMQDIRGRSFLSCFYVPDLALIQTPTQNDRGETRNLSYDSQLEELDESLWHFFQYLKQKKLWDSTTIVLVGLNGPDSQERTGELSNSNLFSERTQVGLLIKPARSGKSTSKADELSWSSDSNVNVADIGNTLIELYGEWKSDSNWPLVSLQPVLKSSEGQIATDRPLLIESAWAEMPTIRSAVRWEQYLFLLDEKPKVYNSLTDKLETTAIRVSDPSVSDKWKQVEYLMATYQISLWSELPAETRIKWKTLSDLWSLPSTAADKTISFERLAHRLKDDQEIGLMYARELIRRENWDELARWAEGQSLPDLEKVAARQLKLDTGRDFENPCLKTLGMAQPESADLKKCEDPLASALLEWVVADRSDSSELGLKEALRKRFLRLYSLNQADQKIRDTNWSLEAVWDISKSLRYAPLTTEMMLSLPETQKYKQTAQKALAQTVEENQEI